MFLITTIQQYQFARIISRRNTIDQQPIFGTTGIFGEDVQTGGVSHSVSFLLSKKKEILMCFGEAKSFIYQSSVDRCFKYSIKNNQWMFFKGRKTVQEKSIFTETNTFSIENEIGARKKLAGWKNNEEDIVSFFGGDAHLREEDCPYCTNYVYPRFSNELWRLNLTSKMYSVVQNTYYDGDSFPGEYILGDITANTNLFAHYEKKGEFHPNNRPGARKNHFLLKINDKKVLLMGGSGFDNKYSIGNNKLDDTWILSTTTFQWKFLKGDLDDSANKNEYYLQINKYDEVNHFGSLECMKGTLINEEEVLLFGGYGFANGKFINSVFKYNISSNMFKLVKFGDINGYAKGFSRDYGDSQTIPGGRSDFRFWKLSEDEIVILAGVGVIDSTQKMLNDEWRYSLTSNTWKYSGKEINRFGNRYQITNGKDITKDTMFGSIFGFIGHYFEDEKRAIICNGWGMDQYKEGYLEACWEIYYGNQCSLLKDSNPTVCLSRGNCTSFNKCECNDGYFGDNCELSKCNGILSNQTNVCSKKGICVDSVCACFESSKYNLPNCLIDEEQKKQDEEFQQIIDNLWIYILVPIIVCFSVIFFLLFFCIFFLLLGGFFYTLKRMKKFEDIEDIDIILEEQKLSKDNTIAHFRINKKMFEIDPKDIKILEIIGKGGGSGIVYSGIWNNLKIAYKCFVVQDYLENKFEEFEKEVELLSSISFPYILTFYGATLNNQRLGFVMEYAENGNLEEFLMKNPNYNEKLRMLYEISSAMSFLHNKKVVHRDLKLLNVLVTKKEETKLMDFGLSKIIENDITKTKQVGTSFFIAPEVFKGKYSYPCDVFSFAMVVFIVLTENFHPFGKGVSEFDASKRIFRNPNFRPKFNPKDFKKIGNQEVIKKIEGFIIQNWDHDPSKRMNFEEITNFFSSLTLKKRKIQKKMNT